jgi:hypothetical protein
MILISFKKVLLKEGLEQLIEYAKAVESRDWNHVQDEEEHIDLFEEVNVESC